MCYYCFDTLAKYLDSNKIPMVPKDLTFRNEAFPIFVTWKKKDGKEYDLRGCIGTFSGLPLHDGLQKYALIAAIRGKSSFHALIPFRKN